ncbi:MAG TPA: hypothetical protein VKY73_16770 [Polyangiaceae bacterium]|nr:hypothetical protein [Polyangiaceae bacterium]
MLPFSRSRGLWFGLALAFLLLAGLGFLPQLGGPGYEAALVAGLVLPSIAAVTTALEIQARPPLPLAAVARGIYVGAALAGLGLFTTLLHGMRVGLCDPREGTLLFVLGPGLGAVLGGATGAGAGLVAAAVRPRWSKAVATALSLLGPLGGIAVSLIRFYTSPMVFAYDPYFGYFSGPLYDTVIGSLWPLATYRLGTVATLAAAIALAALVERGADGRLALFPAKRPGIALGFLLALGASGLVTAFGPALGHYATGRDIERALGRRVSVGRCDVVHSSAVPPSDARRLGAECQAHLTQIERYFGASGPERVKVLLFASEAEKARWMGAGRTYIAKPWRNEVYIQGAAYPHPVLGHELAHVVAGSFAKGPFRVAGPLGGWIPDPGRIEGVAVAAAPNENDQLSVEGWAAAQLELGLLPRLSNLFRLGFFGEPAARAYTAAGAFVRFLHAELGAEAVRRWYGGESLEAVTKMSLSALERRWHERLRAVQLTEAELATARARFDRPAFFERRCPRVIDRLAGLAAMKLAVSDIEGARETYAELLALDAADPGARLGMATCSARAGEDDQAEAVHAALAADSAAPAWARTVALEARADLLLRRGELEAARSIYAELAQKTADPDRLRTLDVKRLAPPGIGRDAIVMLLIGDADGPSWDVAAAKLGEWSALDPKDGLPEYLLGRNLMGRGRMRHAAEYLERALGKRLPEPHVRDEALRLRLVAACAEGDTAAARRARDALLARDLSAARREGLQRFSERCGLPMDAASSAFAEPR